MARFPVRLSAIVAAGVALRALYLFTVARHVSGVGDWWFYHWQANDLASGKFFIEPFRLRLAHQEFPSAGHPPLYPALLSIVSWLGGTSVMWHRAFGLLCGATSIALMGVLGRRVGGEKLGLVAAGVCAVYPLMVVVDGALMSETLYTPLVILVLLAAFARRSFLLGAAIGLAALCRSEALLLLPSLAWPLLWRSGLTRVALATLGCVLVIAPWTIRNAIALDHLVPISTNDSTVIAGANCPKTYSGEDIGFWRLDCLPPRRVDNEAEQSDIWRANGLRYAREHASRLLRGDPGAGAADVLDLSAAAPGPVRRGTLDPRRAAGGRGVLPARAARDRGRADAARLAVRPAGAARRGADHGDRRLRAPAAATRVRAVADADGRRRNPSVESADRRREGARARPARGSRACRRSPARPARARPTARRCAARAA